MPEVTAAWVAGLSSRTLEGVITLGAYRYQAVLLRVHTESAWAALDEAKTEKAERQVFAQLLQPHYRLWVSMLYVVHEGFVSLDIQDLKLQRIRDRLDIDKLRHFRNATFHYQKRWRDPRHSALIEVKAMELTRQFHDRQDLLVRRMLRFIKHNPHADEIV